jgi:hypothetical protein
MITTSTGTNSPPLGNIRMCLQCATPYDWRRSSSKSLKMTYCSVLCERASLGFTIEALLAARRAPREAEAAEDKELVAA